MPVIVIQDFSGMIPLRDGLLLPDKNAQYSKNTWLYKGTIRGFRHANQVFTAVYSDTQQVYRIPESMAEPPDFSTSKWLEYPDPFMATIRNPVVGDQWNRYYFFPSDQYASTGVNPDWPVTRPKPQYRTYDPATGALGPLLTLGIPTPISAPTVVAAPSTVTIATTAATPAGDSILHFSDTTSISEGMEITDTTTHTVTYTTTSATNPGSTSASYPTIASTSPSTTPTTVSHPTASTTIINTNILPMSSVAGVTVGMIVTDITNPSSIPAGTTVSSISGLNVTISQNVITGSFVGEVIQFQSIPPNVLVLSSVAGAAVGMGVINNSNPSSIASGTTITAISGALITLSANVVSIVNIGDVIQCGNIAPNILAMNSVTGILIGMTITDNTNSNALIFGTTVTGISGLSVTMSQDVASSGVAAGDSIKFENIPLPSSATVSTVAATTITMSDPAIGAGVSVGDSIEFDVNQTEARAYVYTYVSAYGEEGPASQPGTDVGNPTGTWQITIPAPDPAATVGHNLNRMRLYRTVTDASGNAAYYQVHEFGPPFPTVVTNYSDSQTPQEIVNNSPLTTELYTPPPDDLQGVVMMANGIAAGWSNEREIWFSAAYLPHAWPASYALTVDFPVVGLTANGASLNIMCKGSPAIATGVTPDTITIGKISANEPCISRGSIVSSGEGAYYASPNGVILLNSSGTTSMTEFTYEKEFHNTLQPWNWVAGHYSMSYVVFVRGSGLANIDPDGQILHGLVIDRADKNVPLSYLHFNRTVRNMYFDEISGQLFGLLDNGTVMEWNPPIGNPGTTTLWDYTWSSKIFRTAFPASMSCFQVMFNVPPEVQITLGSRNTDQNQIYDPTKQYLIVKIYADDRFIVVREVQKDKEVLRIPDGFKATFWEVVFEGQVEVSFFKMATSVKELRKA